MDRRPDDLERVRAGQPDGPALAALVHRLTLAPPDLFEPSVSASALVADVAVSLDGTVLDRRALRALDADLTGPTGPGVAPGARRPGVLAGPRPGGARRTRGRRRGGGQPHGMVPADRRGRAARPGRAAPRPRVGAGRRTRARSWPARSAGSAGCCPRASAPRPPTTAGSRSARRTSARSRSRWPSRSPARRSSPGPWPSRRRRRRRRSMRTTDGGSGRPGPGARRVRRHGLGRADGRGAVADARRRRARPRRRVARTPRRAGLGARDGGPSRRAPTWPRCCEQAACSGLARRAHRRARTGSPSSSPASTRPCRAGGGPHARAAAARRRPCGTCRRRAARTSRTRRRTCRSTCPLDRVLEGSSSGHTGAALNVPLHPVSVAADLVLLQHLVAGGGRRLAPGPGPARAGEPGRPAGVVHVRVGDDGVRSRGGGARRR